MCSHPNCDQPAARVEMHHATADFAKGGKTDITDLALACGRHNWMVGEGSGKYTTGVEREGPDRGRRWWRVNASPGRPPNPKWFNQIADISGDLRRHVEQVRAEVQGSGCSSQPANPRDALAIGRAAEDDGIARYVDELAASWHQAAAGSRRVCTHDSTRRVDRALGAPSVRRLSPRRWSCHRRRSDER